MHRNSTVDREILVVKNISWLPQTTKNLHTKFISQPIIASCQWQHIFTQPLCACFAPLLLCDTWMVFLTREPQVRSVQSQTIAEANHEAPSKSHQRQQQEARTFASRCSPDILVNVVLMNAARLFVLRTYMYSVVDSFVASTYVRPSVTEPGNEIYRRIYPLKIFRWYSQTTKNLLHEKRTPQKFTTRKFPDLRYLQTTAARYGQT